METKLQHMMILILVSVCAVNCGSANKFDAATADSSFSLTDTNSDISIVMDLSTVAKSLSASPYSVCMTHVEYNIGGTIEIEDQNHQTASISFSGNSQVYESETEQPVSGTIDLVNVSLSYTYFPTIGQQAEPTTLTFETDSTDNPIEASFTITKVEDDKISGVFLAHLQDETGEIGTLQVTYDDVEFSYYGCGAE